MEQIGAARKRDPTADLSRTSNELRVDYQLRNEWLPMVRAKC
jgi:hypothetical protein